MYRQYTTLHGKPRKDVPAKPDKKGKYSNGKPTPSFDAVLWALSTVISLGDDSEDEEPTTEVEETEKPPAEPEKPTEGAEEPEKPPMTGAPIEAPKPAPVEGATAIETIGVDYMKPQNRFMHHTHLYGGDLMVLRRGQEFTLKIKLNAFDAGKDRIQIQFLRGEKPQRSKGTLINIDVCESKAAAEKDLSSSGWSGYISDTESTNLTVTLTSSAHALVGKYRLRTRVYDLQSTIHKKVKTVIKEEAEPIYLIFNAWCKDDQVYMENQSDRDEYVMNENGKIWRGSTRRQIPKQWNFGQFSRTSFKAAIYLLEISDLAQKEHGNATLVTRKLTAGANNCNTYHGVLEGNWTGTYDDGVSPTAWNGSQGILEKFMENVDNQMLTEKSVKYGQCWVFSGLLTTLCRTLGIPCRSVTNFASAHDTDLSLTIDKHTGVNGEPKDHMDDSVWNFHVWNEACFKRPDLPAGYDGWQAIDSTPQEYSEGAMQCGPASVKAIQEGNLYLGFDAKFIFAEVNGDRIEWEVAEDGNMTPKPITEYGKHSVGKFISTKKVKSGPDDEWREDVTNHYKFPEGSEEERKVMAIAKNMSSRAADLESVKEQVQDVEFSSDFQQSPNGDMLVTFSAENTSAEVRNVSLKFDTSAGYYTGRVGKELSNETTKMVLQPKEKKSKTWDIKAISYLNDIDEDANLHCHIWSKVKKTGQWYTETYDGSIYKPDLDLKVSNEKPKVGEKFTVTIEVWNPVNVELTKGRINLEGPGIQKNMEIIIDEPIPPMGGIERSLELSAKYSGERAIVACFNSKQITDMTGEIVLHVGE